MAATGRFLADLASLRPLVRMWIGVLAGANGVVPLFLMPRPEALAALAVFVLSGALMTALHARFGFTRVLGAGHVLWIPLVGWLASRLAGAITDPALFAWMTLLIALNLASLALDARDLARYSRGDRSRLDETPVACGHRI